MIKSNKTDLVEEVKKSILNEQNHELECKEVLEELADYMELEVETGISSNILGNYSKDSIDYISLQIEDEKYAEQGIKELGFVYNDKVLGDRKGSNYYTNGDVTLVITMRYKDSKFIGYVVTAH